MEVGMHVLSTHCDVASILKGVKIREDLEGARRNAAN